jgi:plastocyanin
MTRLVIVLLVLGLLVSGAVSLTLSFFLLSARSALDTPNPLAITIADTGKSFLVPGDVAAKTNPVAAGVDVVQAARHDYTARCVVCHGADGKANTTIGSHIYPRAADLTAARTQGKSDGTLFWIIQNGLPHTGMPGWKDSLSDDQIWRLVQLVRQLPHGLPPEPTPTPAPTAPSGQTKSVTVDISNAVYEPSTLTVAPGTRVVWLNHDDDDHTVTSAKDAPQVLNSPTLKQNQTYEFTFTEKGTYHYICQVHDYMEGTVVVQ